MKNIECQVCRRIVCGWLKRCHPPVWTAKGSTTLTITDNVTKDVETVEVKVTDCYLAYVINDSNHPILPAGTTLF